MRAAPTLDELEHLPASLAPPPKALAIDQLALRGGKKLSHMALSKHSPTEPIEGFTRASLQRLPKAIELYTDA